MARSASLSGFPEFLPRERAVELHFLDTLRRVFELHGFASVETRAVEPVDELLRKGEIDKEIYGVQRLASQNREAKLALHFDLTVPFARYVRENLGHLEFPFRRYQIQKVWRGERPQEGRSREFTQADIDVVGRGTLSLRHDIDLLVLASEALGSLPIPQFTLRVNNRKLVEGFYRGLGIDDLVGTLRTLDKLEKIGPAAVARTLREENGATEKQARAALDLASIRTPDASFVESVRSLGVEHPQLEEGLDEMVTVLTALREETAGNVVADLSIARGLDYYTGTVLETFFDGQESLGSICSGGRYDDLVRKGQQAFPGVGLSVGISRILAFVLTHGMVAASRSVPTVVFISVASESERTKAQHLAREFRSRGIAAEVAATADPVGKQIQYAARRGVPYVWFFGTDHEGGSVKDLRSGIQQRAEPQHWSPKSEDRQTVFKPELL